MNRQRIADMTTLFVMLGSFFSVFVSFMSNFTKMDDYDPSVLMILSIIICFISCIVWAVLYIVRTVISFRTGEDGKFTPVLQAVLLPASVLLTALLANGAWCFNREFLILNILSVIGVAVQCACLIVLFFVYYGKDKTPVVSLILYIIAVIVTCISESYAAFIGNIFMILFIPALFAGYIERVILTLIDKRRSRRSVY